jgi:hypothetical protein
MDRVAIAYAGRVIGVRLLEIIQQQGNGYGRVMTIA